jgi:steroid delta-isomerase-like uncharacterized protein
MKKIILLVLSALIMSCAEKKTNQVVQAKKEINVSVKMYTELWDDFLSGNTNAISNKTFTEDVIVVTANGNIQGIEAVREFYLNYLMGFSEIDFKIIDAFGQGNKLIKHYNFKGKHTGDFFGIPATGNYLNLSGTTMVTMRDGKIAKEQDFFDMKSLLDQLEKGEGNVTVDNYQPIN